MHGHGQPATRSSFDNDECHVTAFQQSAKQLIVGHTTLFIACTYSTVVLHGPDGESGTTVTGELRLQLATRGDSYHCFISTRQTGSIASVSRQTFLD